MPSPLPEVGRSISPPVSVVENCTQHIYFIKSSKKRLTATGGHGIIDERLF